jgi:plasmid stability protein
MATLTIRNLPEELHRLLKERAKMNRRSLNQEVIAELAAVPEENGEASRRAASQARMAKALGEIEEMRKGLSRFMSAEEIDAAKAEGRR